MSEKQLMEYWNYTESDLNANRRNQLTERQKTLLAEKLKETRKHSGCLGLLVIGLFGFAVLVTFLNSVLKVVNDLRSGAAINEETIAILAVFSLLLVIMLSITIAAVSQMRKKTDHTIRRAEGTVNFVWTERAVKTSAGTRTKRSLEMRVGPDANFVGMEDKLPNLINQGEEWIFYYTNYPFMFLSAEKMEK